MYHVETCMFYVCLYLDSIIQCIKRVFESINSAPSRGVRELRRTRVIRVRNVYHIRINTCETSVSRCDHSSREATETANQPRALHTPTPEAAAWAAAPRAPIHAAARRRLDVEARARRRRPGEEGADGCLREMASHFTELHDSIRFINSFPMVSSYRYQLKFYGMQ